MNILTNKRWINFDFEMIMEKNAIANSNLEFSHIDIKVLAQLDRKMK